MILRPYQQQAIDAALQSLADGKHPLLSLPTGSGKSLVLAALAKLFVEQEKRVLVATHRRELLEQDERAFRSLAPDVATGIYSAGLERRDTTQPVIFGGVQSIYKRMVELQAVGRFGLVIIDEVHLLPRDEEAMYQKVLSAMPGTPRVGLTATPYRLDSGMLHEGEGAMFNDLALHIPPLDLVPEFLSPLVGINTDAEISTVGVHSARGDYITSELEQVALDEDLIRQSVAEAIRHAKDRHHWLVFCITVAHAEAVTIAMSKQGVNCALIAGKTPKEERDTLLQLFREGRLRALVNIQVLTTGLDLPLVDCLVIFRPTQSKSLFVQIVGRGMRKADGKINCIAEGQRVLTDHGLIPIEKVTTAMRVWDGIEFVTHDGVICQGGQEVIIYAGLTATPDHRVWTKEGWQTLGDSSATRVPLSVTEISGTPVSLSQGCLRGDTEIRKKTICSTESQVYSVWKRVSQGLRQLTVRHGGMPILRHWKNQSKAKVTPFLYARDDRVSDSIFCRNLWLFPAYWGIAQGSLAGHLFNLRQFFTQTISESAQGARSLSSPWQFIGTTTMVNRSVWNGTTALRQFKAAVLAFLRRKGSTFRVLLSIGDGTICAETSRATQEVRNRSDRLYGELCAGEFAIFDEAAESRQYQTRLHDSTPSFSSTTSRNLLYRRYDQAFFSVGTHVRTDSDSLVSSDTHMARPVYDIINCGPRHSFTVEGVLVSNCQVLDFAGNLERHRSINTFAEIIPNTKQKRQEAFRKELEEREERLRQQREIEHDRKPSLGDPMAGGNGAEHVRELNVLRMSYFTKAAKQYGATNLAAVYYCPGGEKIYQWLCPEYPTKARYYAERWFNRRGRVAPSSAKDAERIARGCPIPAAITVQKNGGYWNILIEHWEARGTPLTGEELGDDA